MNADMLVSRWARPARIRAAADSLLIGLPLPLIAAAAAWRWQSAPVAWAIALAGITLLAMVAHWHARRFDHGWVVRRLDAERADMEDSADLLFVPDNGLNGLQRLQRARLEGRLAPDAALALRPAWSSPRIAAVWIAGVLTIAAILLWPSAGEPARTPVPGAEGGAAPLGAPRLVAQRLRIVPPAYTGLPARDETGLDAKVPQGSRLEWTLRFQPQPAGAALTFHDGGRLALRRSGGTWMGDRLLTRSLLYRVSPQGAEARKLPPLHRLDAIADAPPRIELVAPERTLSLVTRGQRSWSPSFDATDDYGVAAGGQLRITVTQGEGENITFKERTIPVRGTGGGRRKRFSARLDLAALGLEQGGDLVAQLTIRDNRTPGPQVVRGPSVILRWPADTGTESSGLEGAVRKALPAYFRSQRQIIIDAEALIKERRRMDGERFVTRSDGIGVDQRILRLRYGQFLGEETGGQAALLPTNDAQDEARADQPTAAPDDHEHQVKGEGASAGFGAETDVLAEYGHTHDEAEAATLLDPDTRATLKQALDEMWQSELHLRQGNPDQALPYAYKALGFIKEVQQATRIFLARVGSEQPAIDQARRLTGDRVGLADRALAPATRDAIDAAPAETWRALQDVPGAPGQGRTLPLDALERWLRANDGRVSDPLAFVGAIDAVRRDPACASCRRTLRGLLWGALSRPSPAVARRPQGDAAGARYLEALRGAETR